MTEMVMAGYLAAVTSADLIWQRIPNQLILLGYMMGLGLRFIEDGAYGLLNGVLSAVLTITVFYIFYLIGAVGAGDVKIFSVIGLACGMTAVWQSAFYALLLAGAAALIFALSRRELYIRLYMLLSHIIGCIRSRKFIPYTTIEQGGYLHFAIYISLGYLFTLIFRKEIP